MLKFAVELLFIMGMVINHNLMAANAARNLNAHYASLSDSTRRLSSGLRVGSAADDAAGLAIRELQRSDIAALNQGARNVNDAISMLQTADSALGVIDEKLIRMKELAAQAATGTYDSTQRQMIDSEFQAMASEIDRIANSTKFNGIHLLNGNLSGTHNGSGLTSKGMAKIHFGAGNDAAEDYYYVDIPDCGLDSLLIGDYEDDIGYIFNMNWPGATVDSEGNVFFSVTGAVAGSGGNVWIPGCFDSYGVPVGLKDITITSRDTHGTVTGVPYNHKPHVNLFSKDGTQLTGFSANLAPILWNSLPPSSIVTTAHGFDSDATYNGNLTITAGGSRLVYGGMTITLGAGGINNTFGQEEEIHIDRISNDLLFVIGGHNNEGGGCNVYNLTITAKLDATPTDIKHLIKSSMGLTTQDTAQRMLPRLDNAIAKKDSIRAHIGALQNRFENSLSNITIQKENLQAAESRISDVDVASEMTNFVRQQILTQASTAMLAQANSMPRMAMQIIGA